MRALEQQQAQELLTLPYDPTLPNGNTGIQHIAVSAPTTPPRLNIALQGDMHSGSKASPSILTEIDALSKSDKRKSVTYAPSVNLSPDLSSGGGSFARSAGAKSMPASRRTSASEHDDDLASHLQGLSLEGQRSQRGSPVPSSVSASILNRGSRYADDEGARYASTYNAGMMLDEQLDQEMHSVYPFISSVTFAECIFLDAMKHLPTSDDDKYHNGYGNKVSLFGVHPAWMTDLT